MSILDPHEPELQGYLSSMEDRIMQAVKLKPEPPKERDKEEQYFCTSAPNAIEWTVRKEFLNNPTTYEYWGSIRSSVISSNSIAQFATRPTPRALTFGDEHN